MHILSLEDDSHNHVKFDTLCRDRQSFCRLSNSTFFGQMYLNATFMLSLLILSLMLYLNKAHNINFILFNVLKDTKKTKFWFCWCFPTNRAHALDLYLVLWVGHTSSKVWGKSTLQFLQVKVLNLSKQKSKLKTKMGLVEEGGITIRGATSRIHIFRAN